MAVTRIRVWQYCIFFFNKNIINCAVKTIVVKIRLNNKNNKKRISYKNKKTAKSNNES